MQKILLMVRNAEGVNLSEAFTSPRLGAKRRTWGDGDKKQWYVGDVHLPRNKSEPLRGTNPYIRPTPGAVCSLALAALTWGS